MRIRWSIISNKQAGGENAVFETEGELLQAMGISLSQLFLTLNDQNFMDKSEPDWKSFIILLLQRAPS